MRRCEDPELILGEDVEQAIRHYRVPSFHVQAPDETAGRSIQDQNPLPSSVEDEVIRDLADLVEWKIDSFISVDPKLAPIFRIDGDRPAPSGVGQRMKQGHRRKAPTPTNWMNSAIESSHLPEDRSIPLHGPSLLFLVLLAPQFVRLPKSQIESPKSQIRGVTSNSTGEHL